MIHQLAAVTQFATGGYRARCVCRWRSGKYAHPQMARVAFATHQRRAGGVADSAAHVDPVAGTVAGASWRR